ncbi:hypothetical protein A1D22_03735 [Pasteurellaceae bacterium LFhippo2]|nr:hypothetical protein [Pasteurellaceae bacterium LFhippo2]
MKSITKYSLTIVASIVLTACSGSGSKGTTQSNLDLNPAITKHTTETSTTVATQTQKAEAPKVDAQGAIPSEQAKKSVNNKGIKTESKPEVANNASEQEKPSPKVNANMTVSDTNISNTSNNAAVIAESTNSEPTGNTITITAPAVETTKPTIIGSVVNESPNSKEELTPPSEDNTASGTTVSESSTTPEQPQSYPPIQIVPNESTPTIQLGNSDSNVFSNFTKRGGINDTNDYITLNLVDKNITLAVVEPKDPKSKNNLSNSHLETLRDNNGHLMGYYGYAALSRETENDTVSDGKTLAYRYLPLLEMDHNQPTTQPTTNIQYQGKMYYHYTEIPAQALEASVRANYIAETKKLTMDITGTRNGDDYWQLKATEVSKDGNVVGRLFTDKTASGEFDGKIYGLKGELLIGNAKNEDSNDRTKNWQGVLGAKTVE